MSLNSVLHGCWLCSVFYSAQCLHLSQGYDSLPVSSLCINYVMHWGPQPIKNLITDRYSILEHDAWSDIFVNRQNSQGFLFTLQNEIHVKKK